MTNVRITKEFSFECAHSLPDYQGKCSQIHGHSYKLSVTIKGAVNSSAPSSSSDGMLADFRDLKHLVERTIIDKFDHALVLREGTPLAEELSKVYTNVIITPFRPTSENMIAHFASLLQGEMAKDSTFAGTLVDRLKLYETATSYVEWYECDNR